MANIQSELAETKVGLRRMIIRVKTEIIAALEEIDLQSSTRSSRR